MESTVVDDQRDVAVGGGDGSRLLKKNKVTGVERVLQGSWGS